VKKPGAHQRDLTGTGPPNPPETATRLQAGAILPPDGKPRSRETSLLAAGSIAGRALVIVVAIMTFLASMTAGTVELVASASSNWRADIARESTIQVRPRPGRDIESDVRRTVEIAKSVFGINEVKVYSKSESERLLEPWLGSGLDISELPVPRLIELKVTGLPDFAGLRRQLAAEIPSASLDDHRLWIQRLGTMANAMVIVGVLIMALVLIATALAIAFATRGAMAGNRHIIEVLNLVGASDVFIAKEFQRHFLRLGLRGGAIGGIGAMLAFWLAGLFASRWNATPGGDQVEALFGTFALGIRGYLAVTTIAIIVAVTTAVVSRITVYRNLRGLD
jgi:cell division transport system permease protein